MGVIHQVRQQVNQFFEEGNETTQTQSVCCVCGKPATRMVCAINLAQEVTVMLFCDDCQNTTARQRGYQLPDKNYASFCYVPGMRP